MSRTTAKAPRLDLVDALVQLSFRVQSILGNVASLHDLSLVQVRLLGVLRDRQPGMLELASFLGLDKSSVSGLVDRAERRGLVQRGPSGPDRRAVQVSLTPAGRTLAATFARQMKRELEAATAGLGAAARKRLVAIAGQIVAGSASSG